MSWFKRKFRQVKDGARKAGDAIVDTGRKAGDTVVDTGKKAGDTIVDTGKKAGDTIVDTGKKAGDTIVDTGKKAGDTIVDAGKQLERGIGDLIDKAGLDPVAYAKFVKANSEMLASPDLQKKLVQEAAKYAEEYKDFIAEVSGILKDYISQNAFSTVYRRGLPGVDESYKNRFLQANQSRLQAANETHTNRTFKSFSTGATGGIDVIVGVGGGFGGYANFDKNSEGINEEIRYGSIQGSGGIAAGGSVGFEIGFWKDAAQDMRSGVYRGATTDVIYLGGISVAVIFGEDLNNLQFQGFSITGALGVGFGVSALTGYGWVNF